MGFKKYERNFKTISCYSKIKNVRNNLKCKDLLRSQKVNKN